MNFLSKPAAVLFATDVAARGLDFPNVDWVIQVGCFRRISLPDF
jgi:ATP-dependent RNA helicase DDX10/DBP4